MSTWFKNQGGWQLLIMLPQLLVFGACCIFFKQEGVVIVSSVVSIIVSVVVVATFDVDLGLKIALTAVILLFLSVIMGWPIVAAALTGLLAAAAVSSRNGGINLPRQVIFPSFGGQFVTTLVIMNFLT